jgi:Polysaccharide pyruvyl transferase
MKKVFVMGYETRNIGDEIQTVATTDILDDLGIGYEYVERDRISSQQFRPHDHNVVVMNGWFTNGYGLDAYYASRQDLRDGIKITWPPTGYFTPLAYSFCLSQWGDDRHTPKAFTTKDAVDFYRLSPGFGCRDRHTYDEMCKIGVSSAYVSKCLTLTLDPSKYRKDNCQRDLVFVDVPDRIRDAFVKAAPAHIRDYDVKTYTHELYDEMDGCFDRVKYAKRLLGKYANAALVVTSRLHVALPCLAFGTPCVFWNDRANSRYDDYLEYMHVTGFGKDPGPEECSALIAEAVSRPMKWSDPLVKENFVKSLRYSMSDGFIFDRWCSSNGFEKTTDDAWTNGLSRWEGGVQIDWEATVGGAKYMRRSKFATCGEFQRAWEAGTWKTEWAESEFVGDDEIPSQRPDIVVQIEATDAQEFLDAWKEESMTYGAAFGQLEDEDENDFIFVLSNEKSSSVNMSTRVSHHVRDMKIENGLLLVTVRFLDNKIGNSAFHLFDAGLCEFFANEKTMSIDARCSIR